jgi:hypothetical protein
MFSTFGDWNVGMGQLRVYFNNETRPSLTVPLNLDATIVTDNGYRDNCVVNTLRRFALARFDSAHLVGLLLVLSQTVVRRVYCVHGRVCVADTRLAVLVLHPVSRGHCALPAPVPRSSNLSFVVNDTPHPIVAPASTTALRA